MEAISIKNDKFSWHRCLSLVLLYKKPITYYLSGSAIISFLCFMLVEFVNHTGGNAMTSYSLTSVLVAAALYFSPIVFARQDHTLLTLLPVKPAEKLVFYLLFTLCVTPIVIEGIWYGLNGLFTLINKDWDLTNIIRSYIASSGISLAEDDKCPMGMTQIISGCIQAFAAIITSLYTVQRANHHRTIKAILSGLAVIIAIALCAGIIGFIVALSDIKDGVSPTDLPATMLDDMMPMMIVLESILFIYGLFMTYNLYRLLASRQVKA
ncbi:MAG: hypothetical protein K2F88_01905 [Duncaniella sp.]|nr:hypothetical protein [Duncaniella sp.]